MYGLPADVDLTFLTGAMLTQVCVGQNEVILNFDNDSSIMIAGDVRLLPPDQLQQELQEAPAIGAAVVVLLGRTLQSAQGDATGTTTLQWDDGSTLDLRDSWPDWESYTISHSGTTIVV
jgi:hypothetical protein